MERERQTVDLIVHREGGVPQLVQARSDSRLKDALDQGAIGTDPALHVFVGESTVALAELPEVENGEDAHSPANMEQTLNALGIHGTGHIHCHRCLRVRVTVNYQNRSAHHRFSPAATIATTTRWARNKFHLDDIDADKLVLQICNSSDRPRGSQHLGDLVHAPACEICFDLVPELKIEGTCTGGKRGRA